MKRFLDLEEGRIMLGRGLRLTALGIVALGIFACSRKEAGGSDTAVSSARGADTSAPGASSTTPGTWTDANIFALLDEANMGDSAAGALASTKGTSSALRDFGRRMARDHHALRVQGEALAKRMKITPIPPDEDNLIADAQKNLDNLNATAKGKDFDKAYIDSEVEAHKRVLELVTRAMEEAESTELKNLIQKAAPVIRDHLDLAQSIQQSLK
jgi:putative membrane protein